MKPHKILLLAVVPCLLSACHAAPDNSRKVVIAGGDLSGAFRHNGMPVPRMHETFVRYETDGRAKRSSYMLVFDGRQQDETDFQGMSYLRTAPPRAVDGTVIHTKGEDVYCDAAGGKLGLYYQCGLSFVYRDARWQLYFDWTHRNEGPAFKKKAAETLAAFHAKAGQPSSPSG